MTVELWNDKTANAIDDFDTEEEALALVRETIRLHGKRAVTSWSLDRLDGGPVVRGAELIRRALAIPA